MTDFCTPAGPDLPPVTPWHPAVDAAAWAIARLLWKSMPESSRPARGPAPPESFMEILRDLADTCPEETPPGHGPSHGPTTQCATGGDARDRRGIGPRACTSAGTCADVPRPGTGRTLAASAAPTTTATTAEEKTP